MRRFSGEPLVAPDSLLYLLSDIPAETREQIEKKLAEESREGLVKRHDALRTKVLVMTGKTADEWRTYHEEIVDYRNNAGAHYDPDIDAPKYPALGAAQAAAGVIYDKLQELYGGGLNIKAICHRAEKKALEVAATYLKGRDAE